MVKQPQIEGELPAYPTTVGNMWRTKFGLDTQNITFQLMLITKHFLRGQ